MKKLIIILMSIPTLLTAQQGDDKTFPEKIDSVFQYINPENATTGILYERAPAFVNLLQFSDTTPITADAFIESVNQLNFS